MALILKSEFSISTSGSKIYVTDKTGAYNATTNPGGWGASNVFLSDTCLLALVIRKASSGLQLFSSDAYYIYDAAADNADENNFEFTFALDGVLDICLIRLPISDDDAVYYDSGDSILDGEFYYNTINDGVYKMESGTPVLVLGGTTKDTTRILQIPYAQTTSNFYTSVTTDITTPLLAIQAQKLYKQYRVEREKNCDDAEPLFQELLKLHEDIRGSYYTFWSNLTAEAQGQVESLLDEYQITGN
jgi:hypothetical protein